MSVGRDSQLSYNVHKRSDNEDTLPFFPGMEVYTLQVINLVVVVSQVWHAQNYHLWNAQ